MPRDRDFANIALLGFMAAGKSSVARPLAERLGWHAIDADTALVEREGRSIPTIFEQEGEDGFRDRETATLRDLVAGSRRVIACGGGAILRPDNIRLLQRRCWTVLLWAQPDTLAARILRDATPRPVLGVTGESSRPEAIRQRLLQVLDQREPLYRAAADEVLDTDEQTPEQLAIELERRWRRLLADETMMPSQG